MTTIIKKLILNSAQCKHCQTILISQHGHDFKTCECGKISIDGGLDYVRQLYTGQSFEEDGTDLCKYKIKGKKITNRT